MIPHPHTSDIQAVNLTDAGGYQFAVWYTVAGELRVGRIQRGVQRWGVDHDQYEMASTPRTALNLPVAADDHNFAGIAVDGLGKIHVWANMHVTTMRAVVTTTAHTTNDWLATAGWASAAADFPSVETRCTYPVPVRFSDGTIVLYLRNGPANSGPGRSNSHLWTRGPSATSWSARTTLFQGLQVPDAAGTGVAGADASTDDFTNWSAYPTVPVVESSRGHQDRMHISWGWRISNEPAEQRSNVLSSYAYSDDKGATWYAIDGTQLTLPITPRNAIAARVPGAACITDIVRGSNIVVATLDDANHGILTGDSVTVWVQDTGYNGTFTVGSVLTGPPRIAWGQAAADDASGGVGTVSRYSDTNWGGMTIDDAGLPHMLISGTDTPGVRWIRRENGTWVQSLVANPLGGVAHLGRKNCFWVRGHLWMLTTTQPNALRRQRLIRLTGTSNPVVTLSGVIGASGWEPSGDGEAFRRFGTVESLACDGDTPRVFTFGRGARARV